MKLTQDAVKKLKPTGKQYYVRDESMTGFYVRVSRAGTKTFTLRARVDGKKKDIDLGKVGEISVSEARKKAERQRVGLMDRKNFTRQEELSGHLPLADALESYLREECSKRYECPYHVEASQRTSWPKTLREKHYAYKRIREFFGDDFDVRHLTYQAVNEYHIWRSTSAKTAANRELSYLSHVLTDLVRRSVIPDNPCKLVKKNAEKRTRIAIPESQVGLFLEAVDALGHDVAQRAIKFGLYSGMRPGSFLSLQHFDNGSNNYVNFDEGYAYLRTHKTDWLRDDVIVPLHEAALDNIKRPATRKEAFRNPWCFPSRNAGKAMTRDTYGKYVKQVLDFTPLTNDERGSITPYSLRHTFAQTMVDTGVPIEDVSFMLSHASTQMVKSRYAKLEKRYAHQVKARTESTASNAWSKYQK
ncbi:integrase family protein [uncultured Roseovarius sp.]|uniref:integrase family protein n=1 Tax=uncultured Roseovarius sp. TaxID=293344 RepID=UPI0025DC928C|nr:integrase family protein [uncultured Roseovarius sp.]